MTHPTRRCALVLAAGLPAALLPALVGTSLWRVWALVLAGTVLAAAADWALTLPARRLRWVTRLPEVLFVGDTGELVVELTADWRPAVPLELLCDFDETLAPASAQTLVLRRSARVRVPLVPRRRGTGHLRAVWARWTGPLGLVGRVETRAAAAAVSVVPNTRAVSMAALRFFGQRDAAAGLKIERYVGEGSEFDSLREYVPGLDPRNTDWKASARRRRLLLRDFRAERNHPVVLAFDTGYLMSEPLAGVPKLDHAINAGLLLVYVGLKTGDRVGLFAFDDRVRLFSEPRAGVRSFAALQRQTAGLAYSRAETNFTLGLTDLGRRLHRRSLIIALTDFVDTVTADLMLDNLGRLARRHLVLFVSLRDPLPYERAGRAPRRIEDLHVAVAAGDLLREREVVMSRLRRLGAHCLEATAEEIGPRLINRYMDIRRRELV
jgi:uncharacterized protein (DUF58 family)